MVEDVPGTPRICVSLEGFEVDHQSTMVEIKGNVLKQSFSILIYLGTCYISLRIVDVCKLNRTKHKTTCPV